MVTQLLPDEGVLVVLELAFPLQVLLLVLEKASPVGRTLAL